MTSNATPEAADAPAAEPVDPLNEPRPLSEFVQGVLTMHFQDGASVSRRATQADARAFLRKQKGTENSDDVDWCTWTWFTWADERVVYSSFEADNDQNWDVSPEDRRRLSASGHPHGVVASLVEFWRRRGRRTEPTYSVRVIAALHNTALDGAGRPMWEAAARLFEGTEGAARLAEAFPDHGVHREPADGDEPADSTDPEMSDDEDKGTDAADSASDDAAAPAGPDTARPAESATDTDVDLDGEPEDRDTE